jgi:FtsZ-binding cell division protein ZapB
VARKNCRHHKPLPVDLKREISSKNGQWKSGKDGLQNETEEIIVSRDSLERENERLKVSQSSDYP